MTVPRPLGYTVAAAALVTALGAATTESRFALVSTVDEDGAPVQGLSTEDFVIEDGGARCDVVAVTAASYPVAIVVDTSSYARSDFQQLRDAVRQFVGALSDRDVALYGSGTPPTRVVDLTRDLRQIEAGIDRTFAQPDSSSRTLDAIVQAARNLGDRHPAVTRIVVLSAGGPDASGRSPRDMVQAIVASRSIVDVIDLQQTRSRATGRDEHAAKSVLPPQLRADADAALLRTLSARTLGIYERIVTPSGYAPSLHKVRARLLSEVMIEYAATAGSARRLRVGVRLPGVTVHGVAVERSAAP